MHRGKSQRAIICRQFLTNFHLKIQVIVVDHSLSDQLDIHVKRCGFVVFLCLELILQIFLKTFSLTLKFATTIDLHPIRLTKNAILHQKMSHQILLCEHFSVLLLYLRKLQFDKSWNISVRFLLSLFRSTSTSRNHTGHQTRSIASCVFHYTMFLFQLARTISRICYWGLH